MKNYRRKVQGDLMYLEVITGAEGVFHITAISSGFYVNRNNRHHFDPTPSSPLHFHHSLWDVLLEVFIYFYFNPNKLILESLFVLFIGFRAIDYNLSLC